MLLLLLFVLPAGCGGPDPPALPVGSGTATSPAVTTLAPLPATPAGRPPAAPATLSVVVPAGAPPGGPVRDFAGLVAALRGAGLTVTAAGTVTQPFFAVAGQAITVQGENVQVFAYADAAAAAQDAARVAPDGGSIGATMVDWMAPPHFYRQAQLLALHLGQDTAVLSALSQALGPPFAGR